MSSSRKRKRDSTSRSSSSRPATSASSTTSSEITLPPLPDHIIKMYGQQNTETPQGQPFLPHYNMPPPMNRQIPAQMAFQPGFPQQQYGLPMQGPQQGFIHQPPPIPPMGFQQGYAQPSMPIPQMNVQQGHLLQPALPAPPERSEAIAIFAAKLTTYVKHQVALDPPRDIQDDMIMTLGIEPTEGTPQFEDYLHEKLLYWEPFTKFIAHNEFEHHHEPEKLIRLVRMLTNAGLVHPGFMRHSMMLAHNFFVQMSPSLVESNRLYGFALLLEQHGLMDPPASGFNCHFMEDRFFNSQYFRETYPGQLPWTSNWTWKPGQPGTSGPGWK
ncbi:hypothetical protein F4776DRAFT_562221 [Hypoxylon sp. NC0597]|nr:hypothetical protein F4776DRAFT_562221 [Hypoxylon sp. NC0597]